MFNPFGAGLVCCLYSVGFTCGYCCLAAPRHIRFTLTAHRLYRCLLLLPLCGIFGFVFFFLDIVYTYLFMFNPFGAGLVCCLHSGFHLRLLLFSRSAAYSFYVQCLSALPMLIAFTALRHVWCCILFHRHRLHLFIFIQPLRGWIGLLVMFRRFHLRLLMFSRYAAYSFYVQCLSALLTLIALRHVPAIL
jgi:hypothetical protein